MADNTVVLLSSDNGPETTSVVHMRADFDHDGARPWRGMKRDQWEGVLTSFKEAGVNDLVKVELSQNEFDALVALSFNVGLGVHDGIKGDFADSTLLDKLNAGDRAGAAAEFDKWCFSGGKKLPGLIRRRAAERVMFSTGEYQNNV